MKTKYNKSIVIRNSHGQFCRFYHFNYCDKTGKHTRNRNIMVEKETPTLITGFDVNKKEYRSFSKSRITGLRKAKVVVE